VCYIEHADTGGALDGTGVGIAGTLLPSKDGFGK